MFNNTGMSGGSSQGFSLFGNKQTTSNNTNNANNTNNNSLGFLLFGNKPNVAGNNTAASNTLGFNNSVNSAHSGFGNGNVKSATLDSSPFGINLSTANIKEMPKSITEKDDAPSSAGDMSIASVASSPRTVKSKLKKKVSHTTLSTSSPLSKTKMYHSNILNGIRNSKMNRRYSNVSFASRSSDALNTSLHGIFSPSKDNSILNLTPDSNHQYSSTLTQRFSKENFETYYKDYQFVPSFLSDSQPVPMINSSALAGHSNVIRSNSEIKKLVIDPDVSAAKRRKLLNGAKQAVQKQYDAVVTEKMPVPEFSKKRFFSFGLEPIKAKFVEKTSRPLAGVKRSTKPETNKEEQDIEESEKKIDYSNPPKGYWCSPSIGKLASLTPAELASVSNFIIGRKNYGQIAFNTDVSLMEIAFADVKYSTKWNLYHGLFTERFIRIKLKTVEVYPKDTQKPPRGQGLNTEATITIENLYPSSKDASELNELQADKLNKFILKLKRQHQTEFLSYIASNGSWTFKVPHFSIWGLIDDSDEEEDNTKEKVESKKPEEGSRSPPTKPAKRKPLPIKPIEPKHQKHQRQQKPQSHVNIDDMDKFALKTLKHNSTAIPGGWNFVQADNLAIDEVDDVEVEELEENEVEGDISSRTSSEIKSDVIEADMSDDNHALEKENTLLKVYENALVHDKVLDGDDIDKLKQSFMESELYYEDDDLLVSEKPYEPTGVNESDIRILEVDPTETFDGLNRDLLWQEAFAEAAGHTSVFNPNIQKIMASNVIKLPFAPTEIVEKESLGFNQLDDIIFKDINDLILQNETAQKTLRLGHNKVFSKWSNVDNVLYGNIQSNQRTTSGVRCIKTSKCFGLDNDHINDVFKKHVQLASFATRPNGFPKVDQNSSLSFELLAQSFSQSNDVEFHFWDLASILFDESRVLGSHKYAEINKIDDYKVKARLVELSKIELLKAWLQEQITLEDVTQFDKDVFAEIFSLITQNKLEKATLLAQKLKNFHLAVLLSLLGSNDPNVKYGARKQLDYWVSNSSSKFISTSLLKIYKLLTGDFLSSNNHPQIDVVEGLSWKQTYMLVLAFGDSNQPLHELTAYFLKNHAEPQNLSGELNVLKLYSLLNGNQYDPALIEEAIMGLQQSTPLDVRVPWYAYEILVRSTSVDKNSWGIKGDRLTVSFAEQLLSGGKWEHALFVYLHLNSDEMAEKLISDVIFKYIDHIIVLDNESKRDAEGKLAINSDRLNAIISRYHVPKKLLASAIGLKYHYLGDYLNEAYALLEAENWVDAHNIILNKVAPHSIIGAGHLLNKLLSLICKFPTEVAQGFTLQDWSRGLGVYKSYILLVQNGNKAELTNSLLKHLIIHLPLVEQKNREIKIALNIISKFVIKKSFDVSLQKTDARRLLELPLEESERNYITENYRIRAT